MSVQESHSRPSNRCLISQFTQMLSWAIARNTHWWLWASVIAIAVIALEEPNGIPKNWWVRLARLTIGKAGSRNLEPRIRPFPNGKLRSFWQRPPHSHSSVLKGFKGESWVGRAAASGQVFGQPFLPRGERDSENSGHQASWSMLHSTSIPDTHSWNGFFIHKNTYIDAYRSYNHRHVYIYIYRCY